MKRYILLFFVSVSTSGFATVKTWVGGTSGSWNNASNWSPSGVPVTATTPSVGDDIIFDGALATTVTITDYPAKISTDRWGSLTLTNGITVNLSSASNNFMYFGNGMNISSSSRLNIGEATSTYFEFGNRSTVANSGLIYGVIEMKGTGTDATNNRKVFSSTGTSSTRLYGKLILTAPAAQISTNWVNFYIESGGEMQWNRDGAFITGLTCQDGGIINITGIVTSPLILNNIGNYYGLIIWNNPSQTGLGIPVVPSVGLLFHVDSIRIVNTGSGSASLGTQPCYSVGHLEVQAGIMNLGSPTAATCGTQVITSDLKITGGTVIGNATFAGDGAGAYPITLPVNRDFIMTGGTFNFTNRPTGLAPGGAMQLSVRGNVSQSGGSIFTTSEFGSQNYINMSGTAAQTLELDNISNLINLNIINTSATLGVSLVDHVNIPATSVFTISRGYLALGNYSLTVPASRFFQNSFSPMPRIVTNGYGKLKLTGLAASSSKLFPVAPLTVNSYDPVTITNNAAAITNDYSVRVERGISPAGIYDVNKVINRTWTINAANSITPNTVGLTYQYNDSAKNSSCVASAPMEEGHFISGAWNKDPASTLITPTGTDPYTVGPFYPGSLDSAFAIGNLASILEARGDINLSVQKNINKAQLTWSVNSGIQALQFIIERSGDGRNFMAVSNTQPAGFSYTDPQPLNGLNYYRVVMISIQGRSYYSNVKALVFGSGAPVLVSVAPNPVVHSALVLQLASGTAGKMSLHIGDMQGRIVKQYVGMLIAGSNTIQLDVSGLAAGTYQLFGSDSNGRTNTLRFVKQ